MFTTALAFSVGSFGSPNFIPTFLVALVLPKRNQLPNFSGINIFLVNA
jgi:hypothetical protein